MIPIPIFSKRALAGVLNLGWIFPSIGGANPTRPNSKVNLPAARIMPWNEATKPNNPMKLTTLYNKWSFPTAPAIARGNGESERVLLPSG